MMNEYTAAIEQLDQKMCRSVTMDDWKRIADKPGASLTEDDITVCGFFGGPSSAAAARARREKALNPAPPEPPAVPNGAAAPAYVTRGAMMKAFESYTKGTAPVLLDIFKKQKTRIDELEARVKHLEAKPSVKFCGTWERGKTYEPGEAVVRDGGLWICRAATPGEPSKDFVGWQLAVRKGSV